MPAQMDAGRIRSVLDEFEIDTMIFTLSVRVTPAYYEAIKENFPKRHKIDMIVGVSEPEWNVSLLCSPIKPRDDR